MSSSLRIVVTGLIAQHPTLAGVAWDYVQFAVGFARLGHDVYYVEDSGEWPYNLDGGRSGNDWVAEDASANVQHLAAVMSRFGFEERWAYRFATRNQWFGIPDRRRNEIVASADLIVNVSGTLEQPLLYARGARLVYIDSDPVFTQVKLNLPECHRAFMDRVDTHDVHFSFGERLTDDVPTTPHQWIPTRTPIVLSEWNPLADARPVFTTVMSWTSYEPLSYAGKLYGQKDIELRRFLRLPERVRASRLEIALGDVHHTNWESGGNTGQPPNLLAQHGWNVVSARSVSNSLDDYRRYIESSRAEWSVAKNGYVVGRPGWFSCRSACYLAAGRPVIVQDTGFAGVLPVGEGILPFRTLDEAAEAVREVDSHHPRHAAAARAVAEEFFDSDRVLMRLIDESFAASSSRESTPGSRRALA